MSTPRRLDPFLLPPSTTSRFLLLIVLTLSAAAYTAGWLAGGPNGWEDRYQRCITLADKTSATEPGTALTVTQQYLDCYNGVSLGQAAVDLGAALVVGALLVVTYLLHPRWIIAVRGLRPFDPAFYPAAARELAFLLAEAGLARPPRFVVNPFSDHPNASTFGRRGRYCIRLNRGLVATITEDTAPVLRAVVRHELAHLRNRDVDKTRLAIAAGWVFAAAVALPQLIVTAIRNPADLWSVGWRLAVTGVLILLVRASVVRAREHYADVRASVVNENAREARFLAAAFADPPWPRFAVRVALRRLRNAVLHHPPVGTRAQVVDDPGRTARVGLVEAVATGVTSGMAQPYVASIANLLIPGNPLHAHLLTGVTLGVFVVSVIGVGLWRATLAALVGRTPLPSGTVAGVGLAAGILLGQIMSSFSQAGTWLATTVRFPVQGGVAAVALILGCLVFCRWSVGSAAAWLPTARSRGFGAVLWTGQGAAALGFGVGFASWLFMVDLTAQSGYPWSVPVGMFGSALDAIVPVALLTAAAFPLLAALRPAGPSRPMWLNSPDPTLLPRPRLAPRLTFLLPLAVFLVVGVVDEVLPSGILIPILSVVSKSPLVGSYPQLVDGVYVLLGVVAVAQLLVVAVVAIVSGRRTAARLGPAHAMVAAGLTGFLLMIALVGVRYVRLCLSDGCAAGSSALITGTSVMTATAIGIVVTVAGTALVALVRTLLRWVGRRPLRWPAEVPVDTVTPPTVRPRRVAIGSVCLVAIVYLGFALSYWLTNSGPLRGYTGGPLPESVVSAPRPGPAGSTRVRTACELNTASGTKPMLVEEYTTTNIRLAGIAAASESAAMRAFGWVLYDSTRRGDQHRVVLALQGITSYCKRVPPTDTTTTSPAPPPQAMPEPHPYGGTYRWRRGETVTVGVPHRQGKDPRTVGFEVTITNGSNQSVPEIGFIVLCGVDDKPVRPTLAATRSRTAMITPGAGAVSRYTLSVPLTVTRLQVFVGDSTYGADPSVIAVFDGDIGGTESAPPR